MYSLSVQPAYRERVQKRSRGRRFSSGFDDFLRHRIFAPLMAMFLTEWTSVKLIAVLAMSKIFTAEIRACDAQHFVFAHQDKSAGKRGKVLLQALGRLELSG